MRIITIVILSLVSMTLTSCAGLEVKPVTPQTESGAKGFRYYEPAPHLLVYTNNQGGLTSQILFLPDLDREMSIRPYNYLATSNVQLAFTNGMLSNTTSSIDETVIPKALISAVEKVASAAGPLAAANEATTSVPQLSNNVVPAPSIYKIVLSGDDVILVGGQGSPKVIYAGTISR